MHVSGESEQVEGLRRGRDRRAVVRLPKRHVRADQESFRPSLVREEAGANRLVHPSAGLVEEAAQPPERHQGPTRRGHALRISAFERPAERRADVVDVELESIERRRLSVAAKTLAGREREVEEEAGVASTNLLGAVGRLEPVGGELSDRLQHGEPWSGFGDGRSPDQALLEEGFRSGEDVDALAADGSRGEQVPPTSKDGCTLEQVLLRRLEEREAPVDRGV